MLDFLKISLFYLILLVAVLVRVAFITLLEQKFLASAQIRVGPHFVGYWGLFQPFADAVKLFSKEFVNLRVRNRTVYFISPGLRLTLSLILWLRLPTPYGGFDLNFSLIYFACVRGLGVYPILRAGWSSNCKFSILGSLRSVAQIVSYEISLMVVLLRIIWLRRSLNFSAILLDRRFILNFFCFIPLCLIWFASSLAETNRTPYDFSEGESELVSGFNTEYRAGGFTLIFMAEYSRILFISLLLSILFLRRGVLSFFTIFKAVIVRVWFIWVRGTLPRYRYDKLMNLAWKRFLPVRLRFFIFYVLIGSL